MKKLQKYKDYCKNLSKKIAIENKRKKMSRKKEISILSNSFDDIISDNIQYNTTYNNKNKNNKSFNFDKYYQNGIFEKIQNVNINCINELKNDNDNIINDKNNEKKLNIIKENSLESGTFASYITNSNQRFSFRPKKNK